MPMDDQIVGQHYYGDVIRTLFVLAGVVMLVMLPFFTPLIKMPLFISIIGILVLAIFAGFLNPRQLWIVVANTIIAVIACAIFEYNAAITYVTPTTDLSLSKGFFWVNQILAFLFFVSIYLGVKSVRGKILSS
jgi:hypothetical protein